jgi:hypothetical protein
MTAMALGENFTCHTLPDSDWIQCDNKTYMPLHSHPKYLAVGSTEFYEHIAICVGLVLMAGIFRYDACLLLRISQAHALILASVGGGVVGSGLTLGLLSLDLTTLKVLSLGGKPHEQMYAKRIMPLVEQHHLLLFTLLLSNAVVNEALPLFLDDMVCLLHRHGCFGSQRKGGR